MWCISSPRMEGAHWNLPYIVRLLRGWKTESCQAILGRQGHTWGQGSWVYSLPTSAKKGIYYFPASAVIFSNCHVDHYGFEQFLDFACSLPVFDVLYIKFNEQKIFKIYFIKKMSVCTFPNDTKITTMTPLRSENILITCK